MSLTTFPNILFQLPQVEDFINENSTTGCPSDWSDFPDELQNFLNAELRLTNPGAVWKGEQTYYFFSVVEVFSGYDIWGTARVCYGLPSELGEELLNLLLGGQGGGISCEELRECIFTQLDPSPQLFGETLERDDETLLFNYSPVVERLSQLDDFFDFPFRKLEDLIPILQLLSRQVAELRWAIENNLTAAAFPEWQQLRVERRRPVGIFQSARIEPGGKFSSAPYSLQIPWVREIEPTELPVNFLWESGNIQYLRVLPDNSKMIVYSKTEEEGKRILDLVSQFIQPDKLAGYLDKPTPMKTWGFNEEWKIFKYFAYWQSKEAQPRPDWSVNLIDRDSLILPPELF